MYISKPGLTGKEVSEALKESVIGYGLRYGAEVYTEDLVEFEEGLERILSVEEGGVRLDITNYEFKW